MPSQTMMLVLVVASFLQQAVTATNPPCVTVQEGKICGSTRYSVNPPISVYQSIPYAEPPTGHLRFLSPVPKKKWNGTLYATKKSPSCTQIAPKMFTNQTVITGIEDCLFLNVFAPEYASNLSVMFWIHGGAYQEGAASEYDGTDLSSNQNVIVVTTNYRLGILGFGYISESNMAGNMGLLDQRMALTWTRNNIAAFGGNPDRITIFGESAGAGSVAAHVAAPNSLVLFRNAIMESGSVMCAWASQDPRDQEPGNKEIARLAGCASPNNQKIVDCLRALPTAELMEACKQYPKHKKSPALVPTVIETDKEFFGGHNVRQLIRSIDLSDRTILVGTNADEGAAFILGQYPEIIKQFYTNLTLNQYKTYGHQYLSFLQNSLSTMILSNYGMDMGKYQNYYNAFVQMYSDSMMSCCGGREFARLTAERGAKSYLYLFNHTRRYNEIVERMGSYHSIDLQFVFGSVFNNSKATDAEKALARSMQTYWANIAKHDKPASEVDWPVVTKNSIPAKLLTAPPSSNIDKGYKNWECNFWRMIDQLLPRFDQQFR